MTYQPDLAYWPSAGFAYRRPEPAVSILQSLCAGLALVAVNVTLFFCWWRDDYAEAQGRRP